MGIQMRPKEGQLREVRYAPHRDIAYLYGPCVQAAEDMIFEGRDKELTEWLREEGVTEDDLGEALRAYCLALNAAHQNPDETWLDVLERTGFSSVKAPARIALMYYIGTVMAGTFFKGLRDVVELGDNTIPSIQRLIQTGENMARYLAKGRIRRWWHRLRMRKKNREEPRTYSLT